MAESVEHVCDGPPAPPAPSPCRSPCNACISPLPRLPCELLGGCCWGCCANVLFPLIKLQFPLTISGCVLTTVQGFGLTLGLDGGCGGCGELQLLVASQVDCGVGASVDACCLRLDS